MGGRARRRVSRNSLPINIHFSVYRAGSVQSTIQIHTREWGVDSRAKCHGKRIDSGPEASPKIKLPRTTRYLAINRHRRLIEK